MRFELLVTYEMLIEDTRKPAYMTCVHAYMWFVYMLHIL